MAQRIGFGANTALAVAMFPPWLAAETKECEAVPRRACRGAHRGTQGAVDLAIVLEAVLSDSHNDVLAPVTADQHRAGNGKPRVLGRRDACQCSALRVQFRFQ